MKEFTVLLKNGTEHVISDEDITRYKHTFPRLDVGQELTLLCAWCIANPKRRKTANGALRFIHGWLARAFERNEFSRKKGTSLRNRSVMEGVNDISWAYGE